MKICVSDGLTFKYLFDVPKELKVSEFTPILGSYLGLKSKEELDFIRLSILPETAAANPWALDLDYIKAHALIDNQRFDSLKATTLGGERAVHILVSGVTRRQFFEENCTLGKRTPSESYDLHSPTQDEDYDLFRPAILIYALAMKARQREMIKVKSLLKSNLSRPDVTLDLDKSFGMPSALSLSNFQGFIKALFPEVNIVAITEGWGLHNKKFVTVKDLENILQICDFPLMQASFQGAVRMAFMLTNVPFTKAFPISGSLKTQYVVATVEPLLKMMLEYAVRAGLNGGYFGVNAGFLPRKDAEEMLQRSGRGSFLVRLSSSRASELALSYVAEPTDEHNLDSPLATPAARAAAVASSSDLKVIHEVMQLSPGVNGYMLRGEIYPSPAAALIANSSFLQNACMEGALAVNGFGSTIGIAAQRKSSYPPFVMLDMAMRHRFTNTDPLDENLLKKMKDYVLADLGLDDYGNTTRPVGNELLFKDFLPICGHAVPPVSEVMYKYSSKYSSSSKTTPRRFAFFGFHGALIYEETLARLSHHQPGSYLLRASQSQRGSAVLAFVDAAGKVQQSIISPELSAGAWTGKVVCSGNTFPSLLSVILAYSIPPAAGTPPLLKSLVAPYYDKDWRTPGIKLLDFSQGEYAMVAGDSTHSDVLFPPVASHEALVEVTSSSASMTVSDGAEGDPTDVSAALPSLSRRADNRALTGWSLLNSSRLAETVWESVIEGPLDSHGVALCAENAVVLPKDFALVMSRDEILILLDEPSRFEQLKALSFLLQRLTHKLPTELDKVTSNLRKLPRPMQEKLIAYSGQTKFFINEPVLRVIRQTLGLAPALVVAAAVAPTGGAAAAVAPTGGASAAVAPAGGAAAAPAYMAPVVVALESAVPMAVAEAGAPAGGEVSSHAAADMAQVAVAPAPALLPRSISPGFFSSANLALGTSLLPEATGVSAAQQALLFASQNAQLLPAQLQKLSMAITMADLANSAAAAANAAAAAANANAASVISEVSALLLAMSPQQAATAAALVVAAAGPGQEPSATRLAQGVSLTGDEATDNLLQQLRRA